jgi:hypothetical protein
MKHTYVIGEHPTLLPRVQAAARSWLAIVQVAFDDRL